MCEIISEISLSGFVNNTDCVIKNGNLKLCCLFIKLYSTNLALSLQKSLAVVLVAVDPGLSGFSGLAWITALGLRCYSHFLVIVTPSLRDHHSVGSAFRYLHFQVIVNV